MPKEPRREQAITYRPLAGGIGLGLPNAGLGISLGLGGVQPAAPTAHPTIDGGNPREGLDEGRTSAAPRRDRRSSPSPTPASATTS